MKTPIAWLENELPLWVKDSLITQENADTILNRYKEQKNPAVTTISAAIIIFGTVLVGLGIISLLAYNWEFLSRLFKTVLAVIILLSSQGFALWVKRYKAASLAYNEAASLTLFLAFICSLAVISQAYNMGGDIMDFLTVSAVISIPIVYFFNSRSVAFLLFGMIIFIIIEDRFDYQEYSLKGWGLLAAWLPWYILHLKNNRYANSAIFLNLIFFVGILAIFTTFSNQENQIPLIILLTLSAFWMLGVLLYGEQERFYRRIFEILSKIGILTLLIFICISDRFLTFNYYAGDVKFIYWLPFAAFFVLFCCFKRERFFELLLPLSPLFFYFMTTNENIEYIDASMIFSVFVAAGALAMTAGGVKKVNIMLANQGLIIISILMLIRFFDSDFSLLVKGFAFILTGALFIGANILLRRCLKDKK
ncbi:MAG: DUF2157 domain-containing protein [Campylobacteraceae bacterium]|jgi:uncharacterized membrane protein|nr:DUF2157 domain-containing protein [Campylobacteraceae bacterium]